MIAVLLLAVGTRIVTSVDLAFIEKLLNQVLPAELMSWCMIHVRWERALAVSVACLMLVKVLMWDARLIVMKTWVTPESSCLYWSFLLTCGTFMQDFAPQLSFLLESCHDLLLSLLIRLGCVTLDATSLRDVALVHEILRLTLLRTGYSQHRSALLVMIVQVALPCRVSSISTNAVMHSQWVVVLLHVRASIIMRWVWGCQVAWVGRLKEMWWRVEVIVHGGSSFFWI